MEILTSEESHVLLHTQATGSFFSEKLQISGVPLAISLWTGNKDLAHLLIRLGAQLDQQYEPHGQTVLHSIITRGRDCPELAIKTMQWVLSSNGGFLWWKYEKNISNNDQSDVELKEYQKYILKLTDVNGLTPLLYATKLGVSQIVHQVLETEGVYKFTQWSSVHVSHVHYDMKEIDPAVNTGQNISLLEYLAYGNKPNMMTLLEKQPLRALLDEKWKCYHIFYVLFMILHITVMVIFLLYVTHQPMKERGKAESSVQKWGRFAAECIVLGYAILHLALEIADIIKSVKQYCYSSALSFQLVWKLDAFRLVTWLFSCSTVMAALLRYCGLPEEDIALSIACVSGWYMTLMFTRLYRKTAFLTNLVHQVLINDILQFASVAGILIIGFSQGLFILYRRFKENLPEELNTFHAIALDNFAKTVGLQDFEMATYPPWNDFCTLYQVLFITFTSLTAGTILIASVVIRYREVASQQDNIWQHNRLLAFLMAERRLCSRCIPHIRGRYLEYDVSSGTWYFSVECVT